MSNADLLDGAPMSHDIHLLTHRLHDVLFVTLNSPATRNALSVEMTAELTQLCRAIHGDETLRAVVLRGTQGFFCAGGNIGGFQTRIAAHAQSMQEEAPRAMEDPIAARNREFGKFLERWTALSVPTIAVVEGAAMGGGMGLACTADLVLATQDAQFALTETTLGIIPAQIAPFVQARIGRRQTLRLGLFGERVSGEQAMALGIVDELAADGPALDALVARWLSGLSRCAPGANRALKLLLARNDGASVARQLDDAALAFSECMRNEGPEGIAAFKEKRATQWRVHFDASQVRQASLGGGVL